MAMRGNSYRVLGGWLALCWLLISGLSHSLGGYGFGLHLQALLVIFPGLYIAEAGGFLILMALALLEAGARGIPVGASLAAFAGAWLFVVWARRRIHRSHPGHLGMTAGGAQLVFVAIITLLLFRYRLNELAFWVTLLVELALSWAVIYLLTPFWCRFMRQLMSSCGWNPEAQIDKP
jgi:3-oxoacyl-(acyl-carrier-protein) synthase